MQYLGSKRRIAKDILPIILKDRLPDQAYVELFCGGCNLIDKVTGPRVANDLNEYLIELWKALQNGWKPPTIVTEQTYNWARKYDCFYSKEEIAFIAIVCTFGAKWFGGYARNKKGDNYAACGANVILKQVETLKGVKFSSLSYDKVVIPSNSIVYCDPPYSNTVEYKNKGFNHKAFWAYCRLLVSQGHKVFISEYSAPDDFVCVWKKQLLSNLSALDNKQGTEKLFVHISQLDI